ncbi:MAG TPA: ParB/RepB/Spo0J family partition protein [Sphingomicrobium sp.]
MNKLLPSAGNVRRSTDEQADLELKANIEARGLLQNLVVTAVPKPRGCFAVEAGGRRLRALQALAGEGKLGKSHEVCCLVIEGGPAEAQEASLAENFQRLSMNPADECLAFQGLIEQGFEVDGIARRFGLTARFVEGRLRLAGLAPPIFEALGAGEISLDAAKAYAATPDRERQLYVFEQMGRGYGYAHADSIRRMMTQATVSAADRRARLVGEEDYVAAGGRIERDLFSDDSGARWLDVAILERLATAKMEALAVEAAADAGLAWVRPTLERWVGYPLTEGLRRAPVETPGIGDEEQAEVDALDAEIDALVAALETEETGEQERFEAEGRIRELNDRIDAIVNKPPVIGEELRAHVGAFLVLDEEGRPKLDSGRYMEVSFAGDAVTGHEQDAGSSDGASETPAKRAGLSQRLADELAMQRRDILAVHVAADPALALDLAIFLMIDSEAGYSIDRSGCSLSAAPPSDPVFGFKTPEAAATVARAEASQVLDRSWTEGETRAECFDAFRALPEEARMAWLGHAVARTLEASLNLPGPRACAFHDHLGGMLGIDVARWWRPTGANYFDRIPKSVALAALAQVGGQELARRHAKTRKAELAEACERIFSGDLIADIEVKEAALGWVPAEMRFAQAAVPGEPGQFQPNAGARDPALDVVSAAASGIASAAEPPDTDQLEEAA